MEKIYRELKTGELVKGIGLPAFIHNFQYHCVLIKIYEDGLINCWKNFDFEGFVEKVRSGWIVTKLPKGAKISRHHSFYGKTDDLTTYVEEEEFIKEVRDTLDELQGKSTSSERCRISLLQYLDEPSESNKQALEKEYNSVPKHLKRYVLHDMDSKDNAIRRILAEKHVEPDTLEQLKERYSRFKK